jgi:hypothetical protein
MERFYREDKDISSLLKSMDEKLYRKEQVTGIIFNLKNNFDWKDKSEVDNNLSGNLSIGSILSDIQ